MMDNGKETEFSLQIYNAVPIDYGQDLLHRVGAPEIGAHLELSGAGPSEALYLTVTVISTSVTAVQTAYNLAQAFIKWRERMRQQNTPTKVKIYSRRGDRSVDLEVASDMQIVIFIYNEMGIKEPSDGSAPSVDADSDPSDL